MAKEHFLDCINCNTRFFDPRGEKTSDLKTGRLKHPYCSSQCRREYKSSLIENDRCKRCQKTRKSLSPYWAQNSGTTCVTFTKGYCQKCYNLRLTYKDHEELINLHETTQTLKKEIKNEYSNKKHRRSS